MKGSTIIWVILVIFLLVAIGFVGWDDLFNAFFSLIETVKGVIK